MNASDLLNNVKSQSAYAGGTHQNMNYQNQPITNALNQYGDTAHAFNNPFDKLNNNTSLIDITKANAQMLLNQNAYKYYHDEAIANTMVQRRVADLLKAGLNPYLANGLIGANGFGGELPQNAANAMTKEDKQKADWKTFAANSSMNIINGLIQASITGLSMYWVQKNLFRAKEDAKHEYNSKNYNGGGANKIMDDMSAGLTDGLKNLSDLITKTAPGLLGGLLGIPNFNIH